MSRFVISDTHFSHEACCTKFLKKDGTFLRPFSSAEEMNEEMVKRWNEVVSIHDTVYHLGDVVISKKFLPIMDRLNGKKKLIMGNHDIFGFQEYAKYFYDIVAYRVFTKERVILSHIPLSIDSLERWNYNIHGHLHDNVLADKRYINVSVERINFTPKNLDELFEELGLK